MTNDKPLIVITKGRKLNVTFPGTIETNLQVHNGKNWWIIKDQKTRKIVGVFAKLNPKVKKK